MGMYRVGVSRGVSVTRGCEIVDVPAFVTFGKKRRGKERVNTVPGATLISLIGWVYSGEEGRGPEQTTKRERN